MQVRTYLGILLGVLVVVAASFLTSLNRELLNEPFFLHREASVPFYVALLGVFLAGFLPVATVLLMRSLRRDLRDRHRRRRSREAESLGQRFRRAVDYHHDGQWGKAASELEAVLSERPEDFAALFLHGEVLRRQGKTDEALEVHRRASVLYPHSTAMLYQLAEDYAARGEAQVALEIRNRILRDFPGQGLHTMRSRRDAALAGCAWEDAARWQDRVEALLRDSGERGELETEKGVGLGLAYQRGVALLEKDHPEAAAQVFRKLLETEPLFIPAGIMLGEAERLLDNEEGAVDEWRRGFQRTGSPVFLQRCEDYFIESSQPARAIETLRALIARADNDLLPRFFLGRLYYRLEMHDEALKVTEGIHERMDESPTYHYLLGRIHQRRGAEAEALASFRTCLRRLGLSNADFVCRSCETRSVEWNDRCARCGAWNSIDLDLIEEQLDAAELGVSEPPFWGGYSRAFS